MTFKDLWQKIKSLFQKPKNTEKPIEGEPQNETPTPTPKVEETPAEKLLWYPRAIRPERKMPFSGTYAKGYPLGAIVHFTAGRDKTEQDALDTYDWGCYEGYTFFVIGPTGVVYQGFPLDKRGSHAGSSSWPGLGDSVSKHLVGIEVACAGLLDGNGKSWFGVTYPEGETRRVSEQTWEGPSGQYKKFTLAQERSLVDLIIWMKKNNPDVFDLEYVLGHNEPAGKKGIGYWRKNDPTGALSMPMTKFREFLKKQMDVNPK